MAKTVKQQYSAIIKLYNSMLGAHQMWELWQDSMVMFGCTISNSADSRFRKEREEQYLRIIGKYTPEEAKKFPEIFGEITNQIEKEPEQDFLGDLYMTLELGSHWHGQFFTPYNVCRMMASMQLSTQISDIKDVKPVSVLDCACGGGTLLIAAAHEYRKAIAGTGLNPQNYICLYAQDLSQVSAMMCYVQLSLQGFAAKIKRGDSLMNPLLESDNGADIWYTPMWFSDIWMMRRYMQNLDSVFNSGGETRENELLKLRIQQLRETTPHSETITHIKRKVKQ